MEIPDPGEILERKGYRNLLKFFGVSLLGLTLYRFFPRISIAFLLISLTLGVAIVAKRYEINKAGVELATFTTIVLGASFNPEMGAALGLLTILLQVMTGSGGSYIIWVIPGYVAAGFVSGVLGPENIAFTGTALTVGLQSFFGIATAVFSPDYLGKFFPRAIASIVFNLLLFQTVARPVVQVLA